MHFQPESTLENAHQREVVWTFEDIRMLIGTDLPIFGGGKRPCVSLRLRYVIDCRVPIFFHSLSSTPCFQRHAEANQCSYWFGLLVRQLNVQCS
jgi:hypothetical protein